MWCHFFLTQKVNSTDTYHIRNFYGATRAQTTISSRQTRWNDARMANGARRRWRQRHPTITKLRIENVHLESRHKTCEHKKRRYVWIMECSIGWLMCLFVRLHLKWSIRCPHKPFMAARFFFLQIRFKRTPDKCCKHFFYDASAMFFIFSHKTQYFCFEVIARLIKILFFSIESCALYWIGSKDYH